MSPSFDANDAFLRSVLISAGAPCTCPPACARTRYAATQSDAEFLASPAGPVFRDLVREVENKRVFGGGGYVVL